MTCTIEVECDSPDNIEEAVGTILDALSPLDLRDWDTDDTFTVVEP